MSLEFETTSAQLRRLALQHGLAGVAAAEGEIVPRLKSFLSDSREVQFSAHRAGLPGVEVAKLRSDAMDIAITALHFRAGKSAENFTLIATGGYGRSELCPLSDIDLLVIIPSHNGTTKKAVETILYPLWDAGLKVGQSVRTVSETATHAQDDLHLQVALLENRLICGATEPYNQLNEKLTKLLSGKNWQPLAKSLVESQRKRREKAGGSAYLQEPDLKNGVGALRDVQGCIWLARLVRGVAGSSNLAAAGLLPAADFAKFESARNCLLRLRCELHFQVTRPTEHLSLERQGTVAEGLGYPGDIKDRIGAVMREYFDAADHVRRCVEWVEGAVLNEPEPKGWGKPISVDGFSVMQGGTVSAQHRLIFEEDPGRLVRLFRLCQLHDARPERALSLLVRERAHLLTVEQAFSPESCSALKSMLTEAGRVFPAIHALREHGLLYRLVPEFAGLHCLVQFEFYHRWTADVHSLRCLWELDEIYAGTTETDRRYREVVLGCESPSFLYAILFLHDIAKSGGIAGHAERGVSIADAILERLDFDPRERAIASTVIRHHLIMGFYWQRHDIDDPKNVERFAALIGDEQSLRSLYVHTRCDARATSPDLWTDFKDGQHTTLFNRTLAKMAGSDEASEHERILEIQNFVANELNGAVPADEIEAHFAKIPSGYFRHVHSEYIGNHIKLIHGLIRSVALENVEQSLKPIISWVDDVGSSESLVTVVTWDRAGLFSRMAGAFAVAGINIVSCRAFSRDDDVAIDFFKVVLPVANEAASKEKFTSVVVSSLVEGADLISEVASEERRVAETAPRRKAYVPLAAEVEVYFDETLHRTVVEIQCNDRLGLLFRLGRVIQEAGYAITFANISTEQGFALDTFYLTPERGRTTPPHSIEDLQSALRTVVS